MTAALQVVNKTRSITALQAGLVLDSFGRQPLVPVDELRHRVVYSLTSILHEAEPGPLYTVAHVCPGARVSVLPV